MIGTVFATLREAKPFLERLGIKLSKTTKLPYFKSHVINNKKIIICISGIGINSASKCIKYIIEEYDPGEIINIGICGMLNDKLKLKSIYIVSESVFWPDTDKGSFICNNSKLKNLECVKLATCKKPVFDYKLKNEIAKYADIVDMEGACIAEICNKNKIPCTILKGISDTAQKGQEKILFNNIDFVANKTADIVWEAYIK